MKVNQGRIEKVKTQFQNAVDLKRSCKIYVATEGSGNRSFYFKQGSLVWASSSVHRFRRLYRLLERICPGIDFQNVKLREQEISELWEYLLIVVLHKRQQITLTQGKEVIRQIIIEVLFDCFVDSDRIDKIKVIFETQTNGMGAILRSSLLKQPVVRIDCKKTVEYLESKVADWKTANLTDDCLPNYAPVVVDMDKLKKAIDSDVYQQLFMYINGQRTFRDLAILSRQDLLKVFHSIAPLIDSKAIAVQQIDDIPLANLYFASSDPRYENLPNREYIKELDLPLIVYVDDDANCCQQVLEILNPVGYQLIAVNDAANTLIVLLKNRPSSIFIDADTTDFNGYELCAQIRKVPELKDVPIIICREREQMLDRLKAKMAGVTDFIDKPLEPEALLTLVQKHTQSFFDEVSLIR